MKSFFSNVSQDLHTIVLRNSMRSITRSSPHEKSTYDDSTSPPLKRKFGPEERSISDSIFTRTLLSTAPKKLKIESFGNPTSISLAIDPSEPTLQSEHIPLNRHLIYPVNPSPILNRLPLDVLQHALSYVASDLSERPSILRTCKMFHVLANSADILRNFDLFQNHGRILFDFSSSSANHGPQGLMLSPYNAVERLLPFAKCGNLQALYMYVLHYKMDIWLK